MLCTDVRQAPVNGQVLYVPIKELRAHANKASVTQLYVRVDKAGL